MTETTAETVWRGAKALETFLVPIDELEPFPGNPRQGDVEAVRASLRRFGQVRPVLTEAGHDRRIVAGHHVRLAAKEEGWTHVAVMPNEFADEDEARAYLLADNRTHDLGPGYSSQLLVEHLQHLSELDALYGTGYTTDDLDDELARMRQLQDAVSPTGPPEPPPTPGLDNLKEVVLLFSPAQHRQFEEWLRIVAREKGTDGVSETTYAAMEQAARTLNLGE